MFRPLLVVSCLSACQCGESLQQLTSDIAVEPTTLGFSQSRVGAAVPATVTIGNRGTVTMNDHGPTVLWVPTKGETVGTKEDFTQLNWSSITDMNGVSNKYSPLYAKKR